MDVDWAAEFGVRRAGEKGFYSNRGQGLDVVFVVGVEVEDCVANLHYVDGAVEVYFLPGIALRL